MSRSNIPGYTLTTCDCCKKTDKEVSFKQAGKMQVRHHILDWQGSPCAGADMRFDFCDACLSLVVQGINSCIDIIRKNKGVQT